ncbi:hypothetical protein FD11_GL001970 [Ligilactobacillus pobuzihii E100301 = KCTC 13174]|nr:hypothetical protein FD11_GL001970 [Ligilactobacillus pobuzihii E100301 = KCTC 13174]
MFIKFKGGKVRQTIDMVDKTHAVSAHFNGRMPFFKGKHGGPVVPEISFEKFC